MTSDGTNCYTYNDANQLSKVTNCNTEQTIAEYIYDYQGNRIEKKVYNNGTLLETVYSPNDGYQTIKLASNSATLNTTYYQVNNKNVAQKNPDGSKDYILADNLGSSTELTNQSGAIVETTSYFPYGQIRSGGTQSKYLYTGQENDAETGLDYYNSRYYSPQLQRFIQPDTVISDVYDPQQLNRYAYVQDNPLTYTDPSGHISILDYNNALNQYYKNQNATSYNNVLSTLLAFQSLPTNSTGSSSKSSGGNSSGSSSSSKIAGVASVGAAASTYSVYGGFDEQEIIRYAGITMQNPSVRFAQHSASDDLLKNSLTYRVLHEVPDKLTARGSEQTYIDDLDLIENGANKINSISINNPNYQQAKDAAQAAGAVPTTVGAIPTISSILESVVKFPIGIINYDAVVKYTTSQQSD